MKPKIISGIVIAIIIVGIRLSFGVYVHDEFAEHHLFIKHRPVWKWKFFSPIGMSDRRVEELSNEEKIEHEYFEEFVRDVIH